MLLTALKSLILQPCWLIILLNKFQRDYFGKAVLIFTLASFHYFCRSFFSTFGSSSAFTSKTSGEDRKSARVSSHNSNLRKMLMTRREFDLGLGPKLRVSRPTMIADIFTLPPTTRLMEWARCQNSKLLRQYQYRRISEASNDQIILPKQHIKINKKKQKIVSLILSLV